MRSRYLECLQVGTARQCARFDPPIFDLFSLQFLAKVSIARCLVFSIGFHNSKMSDSMKENARDNASEIDTLIKA